VTVNLTVRAAVSFGGSVRSQGFVLNPCVTYRDREFIGGTSLSLSLGPIFATERLMDYFYEVHPQFALPGGSAERVWAPAWKRGARGSYRATVSNLPREG
jgi:hypothetical protein